MLYLATITVKLAASEASDVNAAVKTIPCLAALLKQNLMIGIDECISMGFDEKSCVRAAFIGSVTSVIRPRSEGRRGRGSFEQSLLGILFDGGFDLIEFLASLVPFLRHDSSKKIDISYVLDSIEGRMPALQSLIMSCRWGMSEDNIVLHHIFDAITIK
jgi:hypothetical protein